METPIEFAALQVRNYVENPERKLPCCWRVVGCHSNEPVRWTSTFYAAEHKHVFRTASRGNHNLSVFTDRHNVVTRVTSTFEDASYFIENKVLHFDCPALSLLLQYTP